MPSPIVEGFSLSHAAILDGSTGLEETFGDLYGISSGSLEPDLDSFDNTGDDNILSTWNWLNKVNVTIESGYIPFDTIALLTGSAVTSSGAGQDEQHILPLWEQRQLNTQPRPMLLRVPSRDSAGIVRVLDFYLYKVQFQPMSFTGPQYKEGLKINYSGSALASTVDHKGDPVLDSVSGEPTTSYGHMVSRIL